MDPDSKHLYLTLPMPKDGEFLVLFEKASPTASRLVCPSYLIQIAVVLSPSVNSRVPQGVESLL